MPQLPNADRHQRQDVGGEQSVGERAVAVGDQRNEAEAARREHAADQQHQRDRQPRAVRQALARGALPGVVDAFVDGVDRARPAFEQGREDHRLEQQMEGGQADALEQEIGGQGRALNFGVKGHHRNEEEQRREHRQRPGDHARDDGVAVAGQVPKDRQDHHRADDIVAEIGEAVERPAGGLRMCSKSARDLRRRNATAPAQ